MQWMKKRSSLLNVVLALWAMTLFSLAVGVTEVQAEELILAVDVDEASFVGPRNGAGAFNVEGDTGSGPQTFQCWGWIFADGLTTNVSQSFNVEDRGAIMTQGPEGGLLAIVGGTGDFKNARGEARQEFTGVGFDFTMTFKFGGLGRRR